MNVKQVAGVFLNMLFRLTISCIVIMFVYRLAMDSYHFGYMVFNDAAKELSPGRDITITIEMGESAMDIGKKLEKRGLIEDAKVFYVQEMLSEYHKGLQPGIYTLNTSMKASEMMAVMAEKHEEMEDDAMSQDNLLQSADVAADDTITDDAENDALGEGDAPDESDVREQ